jgi:hypothetical protein
MKPQPYTTSSGTRTQHRKTNRILGLLLRGERGGRRGREANAGIGLLHSLEEGRVVQSLGEGGEIDALGAGLGEVVSVGAGLLEL